MSETYEHSPLEDQSVPEEPAAPLPDEKVEANAGSLPNSPVERAIMESEGKIPVRNEIEERSTMIAFGLLFVLPLLIILFAALLLLPFINAQLTQDADPGGAIVQTGPNLPPPTR